MKKVFFYLIAITFAIQGWSQTVATTPYSCNFEDLSERSAWTLSNGSYTNQWYIGQAVTSNDITGYSLYVSNATGATNTYNDEEESYCTATREIEFTGANGYLLQFDVRVGGEEGFDYLKVFLVDQATSYTASNYSSWSDNDIAEGAIYSSNGNYYYCNPNSPTQIVHITIYLPYQGEIGTVKKLIFGWVNDSSSGDQPPACIDNISMTELSCARPISLAVPITTINTTDAQVTWLASGSETNYTLQYKLFSDTWTNATEITNVSSGYQITGLIENTLYDVRVKSICVAGVDESVWTDSISFRTACDAITALPWSESFDTYGTGTGIYPSCWSKINTYSSDRPYIKSTNHSAPGSLYFQAGSGTYNIATTPLFDASSIPINELMAQFYYKNTNATDKLTIGVMSDPNNASTFDSITTITAPIEDTWAEYEVNFNSYTGTGQYIAFKNEYTTTTARAYIDDLVVNVIPTCNRPSDITFANLTTTSADISWIPGNSTDDNWWLYWKTENAINYDSINIITNPYQLQNLTSNTIYNVYISTACGSEISQASNLFSFRTECDAITTLPWSESFDNYGTGEGIYPPCWSKINTYSSDRPYIKSTNHSAPGSLYFYAGSGTYNIATTPLFDASSIPINELMAQFYYKNTNATDKLTIGVMSDPNNASTFDSITTIIAPIENTWAEYEVNFNSYTGTGQYIAFKNEYTTTTARAYIDDLVVDIMPLCPNTYSLEVSSITSADITLNWNNTNSVGQGWEISYGAVGSGFDPNNGIIVFVADDPTNPPYTINGLTSGTVYSFAVRQACGGNWSNIVTANLLGLPAQLPYTCNFENTDEQNAWYLSNGTATNKWFIGSAVNTNPITGNSLYISNTAGTTNAYSDVDESYCTASREIEFTGANSYTLEFDIKMGGEGSALDSDPYAFDYIKIFLVDQTTSYTASNSSSWSDHEVAQGAVYSQNGMYFYCNEDNPNQIVHITIILPYQGEAGTVKKLIFGWVNDNSGGEQPPACIDNISISEISCIRPTALNIAATTITANTAEVTWTAGGSETDWTIQYKLSSDTDWTNATELTNVSSGYQITSLNPITAYDVRVKSICTAGVDESLWTDIVSFRTQCESITTFPWTENFENGLNCWTLASSGTDDNYYWRTMSTGTDPTCSPYGDTTMAQYNSYNIEEGWSTMATPVLSFNNGSDMHLSFWMYRDNDYSNSDYNLEGVYAYINSSPDTIGGTLLGYTQRYRTTNGWDSISYIIPSTITGNQYIILKALSANGNNIYVDNLTVDFSIVTSCPAPTAINVNNIRNTTADVAWTAGGSETAWQVRLGTTGTPIDVNIPSYQLTNLTAATNYTVYIRANCGTSFSAWVASTQFTTTNVVVTPPTVVTDSVSAIAQNQANLYGTITTGTETISAQGFAYKLTSASTWISVAATGINMIYNLTGLMANSSYDFRAFATTATNTYYGNILNFTTTNVTVTPPTVVTDSVSAITHNQANLYGTITAGTETISAQGFAYKLASASTWTNVSATGATMTYNLTGLAANTAYEFKAFATTASNTYYGNIKTFNTLSTPVVLGEVTTQAVTNLVDHSALLHGTLISVGNAVENIEVGFVYSTETNPVIDENDAIKELVTYFDGMTTYDKSIIGLLSGTNYYYKAYVTNSAGTAYGQEQPFLTSSLNDAERNQFTISMYPNPTTSTTKLVVNGIEGEAKIVISDVQGRILNTTIAKAIDGKVEQTIDVNNFSKGIYYVRIQNTTTSRTQKLIVK